jgi:hypothetical protein
MRTNRRKDNYKESYPRNYSDEAGYFESGYVYQTSVNERSKFAFTVMDNIRYAKETIIQLKQSEGAIAMFLYFLLVIGVALSPIATYLSKREQS